MQTLDLSVLRTLIAAAESGSFVRAAQRVGRSESAISLQLKRLDEQVGLPMFRRVGRNMELTEAGNTMLAYARRMIELNDEALDAASGAQLDGKVVLGVPSDFAETWLPAVVAKFTRSHPGVAVRTVVDRGPALLARLERGELNLAMVFVDQRPAKALWSAELPMAWIGPRDFVCDSTRAVPLAVFDPPCAFRAAATASLDRAGIGSSIAFVSPSLSGLWAAVNAGLGITVRTPAGLPPHLSVLRHETGLPQLPVVNLALHAPAEGPLQPSADRLRQVLVETLDTSFASAM